VLPRRFFFAAERLEKSAFILHKGIAGNGAKFVKLFSGILMRKAYNHGVFGGAPPDSLKRGIYVDYTYLLILALVLLSTKLLGLVTEKIHMPQVVGALLAGIILGPSGLGVLESTDFLVKTAEIGVIMVMFLAGIDTDLNEMKETGLQACAIAVMGVIVPMVLCGGVYYFFFEESNYYYFQNQH
jgi:hypothetical protein